jgi:1-acyl-sn-glycerol-3-phosphate acyltransferase
MKITMKTEVHRFGDFTKEYYLPARPFGFAVFRLYFRLKVTGVEYIPTSGPGIIVPNHTSFLDPPLLSAVVPRVVYYLMLAKHYYHPWWHWLFSRLPCIPMKRGSATNMGALKQCLQVLKHNQLLCMFPEGGIRREYKTKGIKQGAALLALRTQAPIIPTGINGASEALSLSHRFPRPKPITINFGAPIYVSSAETQEKALLREITEKTMTNIISLLTGVK